MPHDSWMKPRRRLYLVRHATVSFLDESGRITAHETVGLTADGRRQAEALAHELSSIPFDRVVSSDLPRCLETASLLLRGRNLVVEPNPQFREIQPGKLRELPGQMIEQLFAFAFSQHAHLEGQFLMGETYGAFLDRVLSCFSGLLTDNRWRHLLIVGHDGVNRALLAHAMGLGVNSFGLFEQDACCLNIIDVDEQGGYLVRLLNHTAHNSGKLDVERTTMERLYLELKSAK